MDLRSLQALEWQRLLSLVSFCATSEEGRNLCFSMVPFFSESEILPAQKEVLEWERGEALQGKLSFERYKKIPLYVPEGLFLPVESLRILKGNLSVYSLLANWLKDKTSPKEELLRNFYYDERIFALNKKFEKIFDERGELAATPSPQFFNLRREKEAALFQTSSLLKKIMDKTGQGAFSQASPTVISGRLVLPVLASKKNLIKGIQLDTSSTGTTVYLEPFEAVEHNNVLSEFESREREEIRRILVELTNEVRELSDSIQFCFKTIEHFDLVLAKVRFGKKYKGIFPEISEKDKSLIVKEGFHPFLMPDLNDLREQVFGEKPKKNAKPLNLELRLDNIKTLVLSGPNGGGKSVALKTIGLLALMNQAAIPIPLKEGSQFPFFKSIVGIIGDPQSISEDSSTFTARMRHLADELKMLKEPFLVILDELNSGTDPTEGSVLVKEIINFLHTKRGFLFLSTHDETLKVFALSKKGMANGAFGFSEKENKPTYLLQIGVIGNSRALSMAEMAGIPAQIVESARRELPEEGKKLLNLLNDFERKLEEIEEAKRRILEKESQLNTLAVGKENETKALENEKNRILRNLPSLLAKWREEFLEDLKKEVNRQSVRKISKKSSENIIEKAGKELKAGEKIKEIKTSIYPKEGSFVKVYPLGFQGKVVKIDEDLNRIYLDKDGKEIVVGIGDIEILNETQPNKSSSVHLNHLPKDFVREIMLIGKTVYEAEEELDIFLDRAYMDEVDTVRIVHGIGSGKLRKAVRDFLKKDKRIEKFESAPPNQGGEGATLAKIKQ
ncbi:MAG: Smr/MutS family protein [Acidobacteria bacterium]|nr:Smr/MutS family protein [Acidobacteriota bacterium]